MTRDAAREMHAKKGKGPHLGRSQSLAHHSPATMRGARRPALQPSRTPQRGEGAGRSVNRCPQIRGRRTSAWGSVAARTGAWRSVVQEPVRGDPPPQEPVRGDPAPQKPVRGDPAPQKPVPQDPTRLLPVRRDPFSQIPAFAGRATRPAGSDAPATSARGSARQVTRGSRAFGGGTPAGAHRRPVGAHP